MPSTAQTALLAAKAGTGLAKFAYTGDSLLEGEGSSARANRAIDRITAGIRAAMGITGSGVGLTPPAYKTYLGDSLSWRTPATLTGTTGSVSQFSTQGDKGIQMSTNATATWSVVGDSVDIVYPRTGSGSGTGQIQVFLDGSGTATTTITTATSTYAPGTVAHVSLGTAGTHSVKLKASGGTIYVDGVVGYKGDATAGITYWDNTHTAYSLSNFVGSGVSTDWRTALAAYGPHAFICDLVGSNEYLNNSDTPSTVASYLATLITWAKTIPSAPTIIFVIPFLKSGTGVSANGLGYTLAQYYTAAINQINTSGGCQIIDLRTAYPTAGSQSWFATDGLHWNDTGHQKAADAIVSAIVPPPTTRWFGKDGAAYSPYVLTASGLLALQ